MNGAWKPKTAGILDILTGSLLVVIILVTLIVIGYLPLIWPATLAIVGGVYSLKRKGWPVALAGSISAFLSLLAISFAPSLVLTASYLALLPIGIAAVVLTLLSKKEFEPEYVPASRMNIGWLSVMSAVLVILSGALQTGIASHLVWRFVFGNAVMGPQFEGVLHPVIGPEEVFYTSPWLITGIVAVVLGAISIVRPEKWNLALFGAIVALIPLGVIATYYLVFSRTPLILIIFVGIGAITLTILSRKQFYNKRN